MSNEYTLEYFSFLKHSRKRWFIAPTYLTIADTRMIKSVCCEDIEQRGDVMVPLPGVEGMLPICTQNILPDHVDYRFDIVRDPALEDQVHPVGLELSVAS